MTFSERYRRDLDFRAAIGRAASVLFALLFIALCAVLRLLPRAETSYALPARKTEEMRLHFLDVGQGDCAVVEFPDGSAMVVDAGNGSRENNERIGRYLGGLSYTSLTFVATHADSDHCGGFSYLLETFVAEKFYIPVLPAEGAAFREALGAAEERGVSAEPLSRYAGGSAAGAYWSCISPRSVEETDENDASAVLFFSYGGTGVLLSADISATREALLLGEYTVFPTIFDAAERPVRLEETKILKVSHHGSDDASSEAWLSLLGAETAIVSCGQGNRYFHPANGAVTRLLASGAAVYRTDELGCLMTTISPSGSYRTEWGYIK